MIKFTPEDLVRYLYNETTEQKSAAIKAALETDWNLRETFEKLSNAQQSLQKTTFSPRPQSISRILEHASKKQEQVHSQ